MPTKVFSIGSSGVSSKSSVPKPAGISDSNITNTHWIVLEEVSKKSEAQLISDLRRVKVVKTSSRRK